MSSKDRDMGESVQVRASELTRLAVILFGGEVQRDTGKQLSWNDTLLAFLEAERPDLLDKAQKILSGEIAE